MSEDYDDGFDDGYEYGYNVAIDKIVRKLRAKAGWYTKLEKEDNDVFWYEKSEQCKSLAREIESMKKKDEVTFFNDQVSTKFEGRILSWKM